MDNFGKHILPRIRTYFSAFQWRNLLLFSLFLGLAFIFWAARFAARENEEGRYIVPVRIDSLAYNEVFISPPPSSIEVTFRATGRDLFRYSWQDFRGRIDTLVIDLAEYREREISLIQGTEMQHLIRQVFPSGQDFLMNPISISLATLPLETKELRVVFDGEVTTRRSNLVVDSVTFVPEIIRAYGSTEALAALEVATTTFTQFRDLRASSRYPIGIHPVEGVRFVPEKVEVHIPVQEFTERSLEIPITAINVPEHLRVIFFPARATVSFSVTAREYRRITADDFTIQLNYYDFHVNENGRVTLQVTQQSEMVRNVRVSPASVEFLFEYLPEVSELSQTP